MGAVDPLEYDTDGESGTGVDTGLPPLDEDMVDILRSQDDLAVPLPLNSNIEFAWVDEGREFSPNAPCLQPVSLYSFVSGVDAAVHIPLSGLLDEAEGQPIELRFRSLVVGAEDGVGRAEGAAGNLAAAGGSALAKGGAFRLFDEGLASVVCGLYPNARPIAATPTLIEKELFNEEV
ncbi:MAG: hypothetical protein Q9207_002899 [Kuettlingeria erythrocarpa]